MPGEGGSNIQWLLVGLLVGCHSSGPPETHVVQHDYSGDHCVALIVVYVCGKQASVPVI